MGSGTGVKTVLVMTLRFEPALSTSEICCSNENGADSDAIVVVTVLAVESGPGPKGSVTLVRDGPAGQNALNEGPKPFVVSTQLTKPDVPVPVVDVVEMLLAKLMGGGVTGNVKS